LGARRGVTTSATDRHQLHPCVSLLDFWLVKGNLQVAVYAHAIDFGTKGYANLIELAALQRAWLATLASGSAR